MSRVKKAPKQPANKLMAFRFRPEDVERLEAVAAELEVTKTGALRELLKRHVERQLRSKPRMSAHGRERRELQVAVDAAFEMVGMVTDPRYQATFAAKSHEERMAWVAKQLRGVGIETTPMGASWGVVTRDEP